MKWLVLLYPGPWRERYGDEFEELLRQRPLALGEILDIVKCAVGARLSASLGKGDAGPTGVVRLKRTRKVAHRGTFAGLGMVAALMVVIVFTSAAPFWQSLRGASTTGAKGDIPSSYQVYAMERSHGVRLLPFDMAAHSHGLSREDAISIPPNKGQGTPSRLLQSDDGSTLAAVWETTPKTERMDSSSIDCNVGHCRELVYVIQAATGRIRASLRLPVGTFAHGLSTDGRTLYGTNPKQWLAMSTRNGRVLSRVEIPMLRICPGSCAPPTNYDSTRGRLYVLQQSESLDETTGPGTPLLLAYDVASGRRLGSLPLTGVTYGSWGEQSWSPGFALSGDGREIALYDGNTNELTLVDSLHMKVSRSETLSGPMGTMQRVAQWLGLEPSTAWAKGVLHGADLKMRFSPNGKLLYLTGDDYSVQGPSQSIGVQVVDVDRGEIAAQSLRGWLVSWLQPAPDGSAVFALAPMGDDSQAFPTLLRLHPTTLWVESQRVVLLSKVAKFFVLEKKRAGPRL